MFISRAEVRVNKEGARKASTAAQAQGDPCRAEAVTRCLGYGTAHCGAKVGGLLSFTTLVSKINCGPMLTTALPSQNKFIIIISHTIIIIINLFFFLKIIVINKCSRAIAAALTTKYYINTLNTINYNMYK